MWQKNKRLPCEERTRPIIRRTFASNSKNCSNSPSSSTNLNHECPKNLLVSSAMLHWRTHTRGHKRVWESSRVHKDVDALNGGCHVMRDRVREVNFDTCYMQSEGRPLDELARSTKESLRSSSSQICRCSRETRCDILSSQSRYTCGEK